MDKLKNANCLTAPGAHEMKPLVEISLDRHSLRPDPTSPPPGPLGGGGRGSLTATRVKTAGWVVLEYDAVPTACPR